MEKWNEIDYPSAENQHLFAHRDVNGVPQPPFWP